MVPTFGTLLACLLAALSMAGCSTSTLDIAEPEDEGIASTGPSTATAASDPSTAPTATTAANSPAPSPRPNPVIFSGHVLGPDPGFSTIEAGCPYFGTEFDFFRDVSWQEFLFEQSFDNWTFAFNVDGLAATFDSGYGGASGVVPPAATGVLVCSQTAVNTDYRLTLSPPGPVVFSGHIVIPDPEGGPYASVLDPYNSQEFAFGSSYDGWTYSLNVDGLIAIFMSSGHSVGPWASTGPVPTGADAVQIRSPAGVDVDFQLMLTPPE